MAQNNYVDSVKTLSTSKVDTVRFWAYSELTWLLKENNKPEALNYAQKLYNESKKTGLKKWIAQGLNDIGIVYYKIGDINKALDYAKQSLSIRRIIGNKKDIASSLSKIGNLTNDKGLYAEAIEIQLEVLKLYEELGIDAYIAQTCNNLANIYYALNNNEASINYFKRSNVITTKTGDDFTKSVAIAGIAGNYFDMAQYDSAIFYFNDAKVLFKKHNEYTNYARVCSNIGNIYRIKKDLKKSESYYREALDISQQLGDSSGYALYQNNLGFLFMDGGKLNEAELYMTNALKISKNLGDVQNILKVYKAFIALYIKKGDLKLSEHYFALYEKTKDASFNKEAALRISEAQTKFDVEKKDLEIANNKTELKLKNEESRQKTTIIFSIIGFVILLSISVLLVYRKKKVEQQAKLDAEMATQKELRIKSIIEAEEKERRRIAQDLHDGVGQILSAAKLNLSGLESQINLSNASQKDAFKNALDLIDDSVKEVRAVSHNMMPNTLIKLGLASAIREFITKIGTVPNLKIDLEIVGLDKRIDENIETVLYRVIQEIVANILKHAKATEISLQLIKHEKELSIIVEDNGVGFDTTKINIFEGIGLKNIISRIEFINGTVHFDSTIGHGTTVIIEVIT
ncbi:MAG: sensor histidine kinase [Bacteroidetes bacterium]|nr:sensor histidine kinase [Bacteroidota bacterium]